MSALQNFVYFLSIIALHLIFVIVWMLMRRTCFSCCPSGLDNTNSPDSQDESAAEEELQINQDEMTVRNTRWVLNWTEMNHRPSKSATNILQSVFHLEPSETVQSQWMDQERNTPCTYVALPMKLAEKLSSAELELGTFAGSSEEKYGNVFRIAKLQLPQGQVSSPGSPGYLSGDLLRKSGHIDYKKTSPVCTTESECRPPRSASPLRTALRGQLLPASYRSNAALYPHTARVAASATALQSSLSTLTSVTTAKSNRTGQRSEDPDVSAALQENGVRIVSDGPVPHKELPEATEAGVEDCSTISSASVFPDLLSASALHAQGDSRGNAGEGAPSPSPLSLVGPGVMAAVPSAQDNAPA